MSVNIYNLTVGKCYKLENADKTYLGKLTDNLVILGYGDDRETHAPFLHNKEKKYIREYATYSQVNESQIRKNMFIEVECEKEGGRRKSRRRTKKGHRSRRHR